MVALVNEVVLEVIVAGHRRVERVHAREGVAVVVQRVRGQPVVSGVGGSS